ncbi:YhgE/Pip family protein [Thermolongibacillus altinsuensis]
MRGISLFFQEIKAMASNRKMLIPVIAVLFIPLLYSGMFLWAFWDPYDHLDELPVAVVNNDKGAAFNGEELHIGDDLVEKLKENKQFDWHFVDEKEGKEGLKQQKYYMLIEIPEDFSKNATTLQEDHPEKLKLIYMPNESFNFLSAQIGGTAVEKIKEEVANTLTATYAEAMFDNIKKMANGLSEASDGAKQLNDGIRSAKDGTEQLHDGMNQAKDGSEEIYKNLTLLAEKSIAFKDGLQKASSGSEQLNSGLGQLNDGFVRMQEGQSQLLAGAKKAEAGSKQLSSGLNEVLGGMKQMDEKLPQLAQGSEQLSHGANQLAASLTQWQQGAEQTKAGAAKVSGGLEQLVVQLDALIAQTTDPQQKATYEALKANIAQLAAGSKQVADGIDQLATGAVKIKGGADQLAQGATQLHQGHVALSDGVKRLLAGQQQLADGAKVLASGQTQLVQGMTTLNEKMAEAKSGVEKLAEGSGGLASGLEQLASGSHKLQDGAQQLADGSGQLVDGMEKLTNGTTELNDGMKKLDEGSAELAAKLKDGAKEASDVKANEDVYDMFAEPVKVKNEKINEVPNYGTGFTPYFLSLGLFVGALLLSIVFPLREPAAAPRSPFSWFFAKFGVLVIVGIIQALLADSVLLIGLDIEVQSVPRFILFSIATSITFLSVIQFLVTVFGDPGRFIAIIVLILQLTTSAGTFPVELIPKALQPFNAWLPMTYSVFGFKAVISSGDFAFMWENVGKLAMFIIVMVAGTLFYFTIQHKRQFTTIVEKETSEAM